MKNKKIILLIIIFVALAFFAIFILLNKIELSENPGYLFDKDFKSNKIEVYGISIGDKESEIDQNLITEQGIAIGWIHTKNNVGYRIANGKVVEIVLGSDETKRIGLFREDEIIMRFGKPDKIEDTSNSFVQQKNYFYIKKGLVIRFYDELGIIINIMSN